MLGKVGEECHDRSDQAQGSIVQQEALELQLCQAEGPSPVGDELPSASECAGL